MTPILFKRSFRLALPAGLAVLSAMAAPAALAQQGFYVEGSLGLGILGDSDNNGTFSGDFTTGAGTTIPSGTVLPDGTPVGWSTEFDTGLAASLAAGLRLGVMRAEAEVAYQGNDVDTHRGVTAAGIDLSTEDAGVLVTGAPNLGTSVEDLVADGQGKLRTTFLMANAYFDVPTNSPVTPYIGAGLGIGFVDVEYSPTATEIIDDQQTAFAYQIMAGLAFEATEQAEVVLGYRYRATSDVEVDASLFSAEFDIENASSVLDIGLRYTF